MFRPMQRTACLILLATGVTAAGCPADTVDATDDGSTSGDVATTTGAESSGGDTPTTMSTTDGGDTTTAAATDTGNDESSSSGEPPPPECGNSVAEGDEDCDGPDLAGMDCISQGFEGGELVCDADCGGFDTSGCFFFFCGNDTIQGDEVCDGANTGAATCQTEGFESGTLGCTVNCRAFDTSTCGDCNNGIIDGDDVCDGIELDGETCTSLGFDSGPLGCLADCSGYDSAGCGACGNGTIDGAETCEAADLDGETCLTLGFDSGNLACNATCDAFNTAGCGDCGNSIIDGDDLCDGAAVGAATCVTQGFDNGVLTCDATCQGYDTSACGTCGDGVIDPSESCDSGDFGGETCASLGLQGGTLGCSPSCQYDFSMCDIAGIPFGSDSGYNGFALTPAIPLCDDISATGTPTGLTDDSNQVVPIGFTFPLYGVNHLDANIQSNGTLRFGDAAYLSYTNSCLPTATNPSTSTLYVFWDDLNPSLGAGEVYYQTLGAPGDQRFVVQWDTANFGGDAADLMRMQVMLHEATGAIDVCYVDTINAGNTANNGAEATAGIQLNSADALQYSCNTPDLTNGLMLMYLPL
jgi:hypothetical protein